MAVICKAIDVIKDKKDNTTGYLLSDIDGNVMQVASDKIKSAILAKQVIISNLKVTSNNRLIKEDIDVSKKFIAIADKISELSGVKHCKSSVQDFHFYTSFENTPIFLLGKLDDSEVTFCVKDKNVEGTLNANTLPKAAALVKKMYCDYITANKPVNPDAGKPKTEVQEQQYRIITITSPGIYGAHGKLAQELGIEWISDERAFRVVDENAIVVVKLEFGGDITFIDSKVHGFKVVGDNCRDGILLKYCEMQYLEAKNTNAQMMGCIVYNTANLDNGTPSCYSLSYINNLKITNYKNIDLEYIICNKLYVSNKSITLDCSDSVQYIKSIEAVADDSLQVIGDSWTVENMVLTAETVRFSVNQYNKNTESMIQKTLIDLNGSYTYPNLYMIICNHFLDADSVETLVKVNGNIKLGNLAWRCKFVDEIKLKVSEDYSKLYNAEFIQDSIPKMLKISNGGIAITNNTDITFTDLKIAALYKSKHKSYSLDYTGIFLIDNTVKNFSITIANSIKPATKACVYDLNLVIKELKRISEINPIKVYYGTQAYEILTTNGVKVDILNKDNIEQRIKNTAAKEKIIGITVMDTVEKTVKEAVTKVTDNDKYEINTGIDIELPEKIIETYNLSVAVGRNTVIPTGIKSFIDMLKLFPANNLPFTTDVLERITTNPRYRIHTELITSFENIMINLISITYTDILDIDEYVVVTNGKNLIYMTYIGDCEVKYNRGSSLYIQEGIQAIRKLDAIDLILQSVKQNLTMSSVKDTKQFIKDIDSLFNGVTAFILNSKTSSIITVGSSGEIVSFKVGYSKVKVSKFDANYDRNYLRSIEKIEPNDVVNSIVRDVAEKYKNSVLLRTKDIETSVNCDANTVENCKISSLWQLAHRHIGRDFGDVITYDLLNDVLKLGFFNNITEDEFIKALKKTDEVYKKYKTDGSFDIQTYSFNGKLRKLHGKYMGKLKYLYVITYSTGEAEYYSADESIEDILKHMKRIAFGTQYESFETFVNDFNFVKTAYGFNNMDADKIAYNLNMSYKGIRYKSVPGNRIYDAIKDAELNHDYAKKEHLLKLIGMTEYEYTSMLKKGTYYREEDMHRNINGEIIAGMPKSQELLDLLGMNESFFDELVKLDKCDKITFKLKYLVKDSIEVIYSSSHRLLSTHKGYSTKVCIGICKKTGYCYLFTINGEYTIPALRLPSFKDAMLLRKQLIEEEAELQKKAGLLQDIGWRHSEGLLKTIELNLNNIKEAEEYPQKYRHLVAYICDEPELEEIEEDASAVDTKTNCTILNGYNQSHLMQFIQMGAVQLVASIPTAYKYNKTYSLSGVGYKVIEYYNKYNGLYAFEIGNDTKAISEYSIEELFN